MDRLEKTILGEFLLLDSYGEQVETMLEIGTGHFKSEIAKVYIKIFSDILFKQKSAVDQITAYPKVKEIQNFEVAEFSRLTEGVSSTANLRYHIALLKERTYKEQLITSAEKILGDMKAAVSIDDLDEKKNEMIVKLSGLDLGSESSFVDSKKVIEHIEENLHKGKKLEGHSWGLADLDSYTSGIVAPRLFVIGGLKKSGKSRFIINTMIELYHNNIPTYFLSLEMPEYEVVKLLISRYTAIPEPHLRSASIISNDEKIKFAQAKADIDWDLLNVECATSLSVNQVIGRIRKYAKMNSDCVIAIDYLQRISHDRNKQAQDLETISIAIADATREYNVPIILLSQLSNIAEREGASIGALKGSGGIGEAADVILLLDNLYRKQKLEENKNKMDVYIEQRYGDSGKIELNTDLSWCKFADKTFYENVI